MSEPNLPHGGPAPQVAPNASIHAFFARSTTATRPLVVRAEGVYFWDDAGRRYIDVTSGPVCSNLGHGNARVLRAMTEQARDLAYAHPIQFETEISVRLATRLSAMAGPGCERVVFTSGGSEATEVALKLARQYACARGEASRCKVISREPSYHGTTLGALSVTGDAYAHEVFGPMMRSMPRVPAPFGYRRPANHTVESYADFCADSLEREIREQGPDSVLAFILEPVGGLATGALVAPASYYRRVREICDRYGVLLIHDEVMCGAGRTGKFLAGDHWGVRADITILAKGIAAGYTPFGAVLVSERFAATIAGAGGVMTNFTYFCNPLSCAVSLAVLEEIEAGDLVRRAAESGAYLRTRLEELASRSPLVGEVRGLGLLLALELVADKETGAMLRNDLVAPDRFQYTALRHGLAVYARRTSRGRYGDWVMVAPPLTITRAEMDDMLSRFEAALGEFEQDLRREGAL
jgi:adenosylmethionine-8-amino-7-oxononanoate aminotransferase